MESIWDKINKAYQKGIEDSRYKDAISEIIRKPKKDESRNRQNDRNSQEER